MQKSKEKYLSDEKSGLPGSYYNTQTNSTKKLIFAILVESVFSLTIYYNYEKLSSFHSSLLAPSLLGSFTAALAQSMNQYVKRKFSLNKIFKFMVWGSINGCFTVLWIDLLIHQLDNIIYRILADQLIAAPLFQLVFNVLNVLWDHGEISSNMHTTYFNSLKYSFCFWPFFSIGSFMFVPQEMMFPVNCLANLLWNLILSKVA